MVLLYKKTATTIDRTPEINFPAMTEKMYVLSNAIVNAPYILIFRWERAIMWMPAPGYSVGG